MCGIAALVCPRTTASLQALAAMLRIVDHRGPDDQAITYLGDLKNGALSTGLPLVALGHRRLSILDLSTGARQPMGDRDGRVWITYNGEVYNYLELRDSLQRAGYAFRTQSDTEVILAAYREWGRDFLKDLNGMFAFVLYDRWRRTLFAARDRFGIKPLYYWVSPEGMIVFASEIKQFTVLPGWVARVNGQRAYDFLTWGLFDHTDETLFEGVYQLRGGEALELDLTEHTRSSPGSRLPVYRWYELAPRPFSGTLSEAGSEFRRLLTESVRLHLRSDVPVGSCLSGGLDSSTIVCLVNRLLGSESAKVLQSTFSSRAVQPRYDEGAFIEEVIRTTRVRAHFVYPSVEHLFTTLDRLVWHQDEPFGSTSVYAQWHVFRLAAQEGVKVVLDGQGADEMLCGYHGFFGARFGILLRRGDLRTLIREIRYAHSRGGPSWILSLKYLVAAVLPSWLLEPARCIAGHPCANSGWLDVSRLRAKTEDPFHKVAAARRRSIADLSRAQILMTSLPMLLHYEDRNSMASSVEARVPFLDHRLVEFVLGLPDEYKIADGTTKRVLREGMRDVLPERVRLRKDKIGFATPEDVWMKKEAVSQFRQELAESVEASRGILRPTLLKFFDSIVAGRRPFDYFIWRCISFGAWMRVFGTHG